MARELVLPAAQDYTSLMLPLKSILTGGIRAGVMVMLLTCLIVNPRYLLGTLEPSAYMNYKARHRHRARLADKAMGKTAISNSLVHKMVGPPFTKELVVEAPVTFRATKTISKLQFRSLCLRFSKLRFYCIRLAYLLPHYN
ncbi:uncharacterized protein B0H18DRAFT_1124948 [Fomitopsis serialis]|uniref:uncharacterized protein n=1 Tax=Fomitopsis serialis TaxID=139415 RepID=UPI0020080897|nr:uncharacterized protein B0H18DRAFT_1124948 [Neoantrodia serialis]KAH9915359.1 hypothetical protein B0H18DRAFT_1124948 [Neoantrodia serialis]